ncbi:hypothetical protein [Mycobacterium gastri]|nr:hypothetical protein [Mycobacterium gastri]ETW21313.1 hypothetical protein MGAST_26615 [Mycobacterium gastri 'Wayne']
MPNQRRLGLLFGNGGDGGIAGIGGAGGPGTAGWGPAVRVGRARP